MQAAIVHDDPHPGVDSPEDIVYIEKVLSNRNKK